MHLSLVLLLLALGLCACPKAGDTVNFTKPEKVALAFVRLYGLGDYAEAKPYATKETQATLDILATFVAQVEAETREQARKDAQKELKTIKSAKCWMLNPGEAECTLCCDAKGKNSESPLQMRLVEGRWLVHIPKEGSPYGEIKGN